jgi:hypothetical protein
MPKTKTLSRRHELRQPPSAKPKADSCKKAAVILKRAHNSADALLKAFALAQKQRGASRGTTPDDEQDLLRAMLVMAAAGLDSMLKQLIRDAMPALVKSSDSVREGLEKFVTRSIRGDEATLVSPSAAKFLGRVLAAEAPQAQVIEEYVRDLTGGSLQSASELARTVEALGLSSAIIDMKCCKEIFDVRNKIIHELDINLEGHRRKRNVRSLNQMIEHTNALLEIGEKVLAEVDEQLAVKQQHAADGVVRRR